MRWWLIDVYAWLGCGVVNQLQQATMQLKLLLDANQSPPVLTVGDLEAAAGRHEVKSLAEHQVWTSWLCLQ